MPVLREGHFTATAQWFDLVFPDGSSLSSYRPPSEGKASPGPHALIPELPVGSHKVSSASWSYRQALQYIGSTCLVSPGDAAAGSILLWTMVERSGDSAVHVVPLASGIPGSWDLIGPARVRQAVLPGWQCSEMQDGTKARAYATAMRSVQKDSFEYNFSV